MWEKKKKKRNDERGRKQEQGGRRQKSKHGQALYTLTPDRPPLAASTGKMIPARGPQTMVELFFAFN